MKNLFLSALCASLMLHTLATETNSTNQLSTTIEQSFFSQSSPLKLSQEEATLFANAALFMYLDAQYVLRAHMGGLTSEMQTRKDSIEKTCTSCLDYIEKQGSIALQSALKLLRHSVATVKKTYFSKYQEELIAGERNAFTHAQALQQITANLYGIWYKSLYENMEKYAFDAHCFTLAFYTDGLMPATAKRAALPKPSSIMQ